MEYRELGATGIALSAVGFGCAPLGNVYGEIDDGMARRAVYAAIDAGVGFFDVSPYYGLTLAEQVLGRCLEGRRHEVILSTKAGRNGAAEFDYSAPAMRRSVEASLRRLKTDYVDLLFAHDVEWGDPAQVLGETYEALRAMKREGLCRAIGMSALPLPVLRQIIAHCDVDAVITYCHGTLLDDTALTDLLPAAQERGVAVINASPTSMGLLSPWGAPPWHPAGEQIRAASRAAADACAAAGYDIAATALGWAFRLPVVASTLIGAKNEAELETSLRAYRTPPDPGALALIQRHLAPVHNSCWPSGNEAGWAAYGS